MEQLKEKLSNKLTHQLIKTLSHQYQANGKLLLTAEYLVLDGAKALALPTNYGQSMTVTEQQGSGKIHWTSFDSDQKIWFQHLFQMPLVIKKKDNSAIKFLKQLLHESLLQNPDCLSLEKDYQIVTHLEFPTLWGLGSSSTLIYNLSQWLEVNPYELLHKTLGGSGYDLACASSGQPITYQLIDNNPIVNMVNFNPPFADQLYFIYLNQKQKSHKEIIRYNNQKTDTSQALKFVNKITELMLKVENIDDFNILLEQHEKLLASVLNRPVIQKQFPDFDGQLKSLGAWGGDFILASGGSNTVSYFKSKGYNTVVGYKTMIK